MYRSRQTENLDKNVLEYLSSLDDDINLFYYDIVGTQAHCIMLNKIGILDHQELSRLLSSLSELKDNYMDQAKVRKILSSDSSEDIHEQIEALVTQSIGIKVAGKMHTGRSRNDQVALDVIMKTRDDLLVISNLITNLLRSLIARSKEYQTTIVSLYTHLQQAQIGTFSHYILSYSYSLLRDLERFNMIFDRINKSPLGACAIGGTNIPIDRKYTASLLGFDGLVENSIDATSSRDVIIEFLSSLAILMNSLSRIAEDFILWSTSEFNYIELEDKYSSTSSVMPQKKNPDPLEILRSHSSIVTGNLLSALTILKSLPTGYSRDLQDLKPLLWKSTAIVTNSLIIMVGIIDTFKVNKNIALKQANKSYAVSLDIAEQLVIKYNIPFRQAHKLVGHLVQYAIKNNSSISLKDIPKEELSRILDSIKIRINTDDLHTIIRDTISENSIYLRKSAGSPNPNEQKKMLVSIENLLIDKENILSKRITMVDQAFKNLQQLVIEKCKFDK